MICSANTGAPAWDDAHWDALPTLTHDVYADVCVVGLGGSGLACVHELLALGQRVVGVDAGTVGGAAAGRNGGFLLAGTSAFYHRAVATLGRERARRIYQLTLDEMERMAAETPGVVRRVGSLRIAESQAEEDDCEIQLSALVEDGFPAERYAGVEGRGLLIASDGAFQPLTRCRVLARRAIQQSAMLFEHSRVRLTARGEVLSEHGVRINCGAVIVAVDGGLETLLPELAGRVRTARLQMLATEPAPEVRFERPVYSRYGYDYWQQLPDGRLVVGGCRDQEEDDEWTPDGNPSGAVQQRLERLLRDTIGVRHAAVTHRWAASVGYTMGRSEPGMPLMDEVRPGIWAIGGYCGTGNVLGALHGRMAAQLAVRGSSEMARDFKRAKMRRPAG